MRGFVALVIVAGVLWALDLYAFQGRYSRAAWQEANYQGQKLSDQVQYHLKKNGL
jgi:hypothetical protein